MAIDAVKNFAKVTVSTTYDATATTIILSSGHGSKLPAPSTDGAFNVVWWNVTDYPDPSDDPNVEIVRVTARTTDTLTVTRGQEGTIASTKNTAGKTYKMVLGVTTKIISDLTHHENLVDLLGGSTGNRYHLTSAQYTIATQAATTSLSGYLTSTDWNTFNGKQAALVSGTNIKTVNSNSLLGSGNVSVGTITSVSAGNGMNFTTITSTGSITLGTPSSITNTSTNSVTTNSHTHAVSGLTTSNLSATAGILNAQLANSSITIGTTAISLGSSSTTLGGLSSVTSTSFTGHSYIPSTGVMISNLGTPTVGELSLIPSEMNNKIFCYDYTKMVYEYTTDDVTWNTWTISDANKKGLVTANAGGTATITYGWRRARVTLEANAYVYLNNIYIYNSTSGHSMSLTVQKSYDGTTWENVVTNSGTKSSWPGHFFLPHSTIPWHPSPTLGSHYKYVRIIFNPTWNSSYPSNAISIYDIQWFGGYPAAKREIYSWDYDRDVTFPATLTATGLTLSGLTASKVVFTDASKNLTSTGIGTSSQFIKGDGSLDSTTYLTASSTLDASKLSGAIPVAVTQTEWDSAYAFTNGFSTNYPDLTAIEALSGTSGLLKKTAANTWTLDTNVYITGNQTITLSGAVTGSGTTSITTTFATPGTLTASTTNSNVAAHTHAITTSSSGTASTICAFDTNGNLTSNNLRQGYTTTATAAGTTTLTVTSDHFQFFTGTSTQTVVMPVTSTLTLGHEFRICNNSTGAVTVNSSGGNTIIILAGGTDVLLTCVLVTGTTAASWDARYLGSSIASGKLLTINNSIALSGTDGTTITLPSSSGTVPLNNQQFYIGSTAIAINQGTGTLTLPNTALTNSSITIQGSATALGGSINVINGTGFVKASGTTISYDNSTYALTNQTFYIGTTAIAINQGSGTLTSLGGLTTVTATTFAGNLSGYKNVDNSNEITIANGFAGGELYFNYRGSTSATTGIRFCDGRAAGALVSLIVGGINLGGVSDTSTAATHYYVETATDGYIRPKTLANVKSEIVTTASVNSAAATTVGTVTSGTWSALEKINVITGNTTLDGTYRHVICNSTTAFTVTLPAVASNTGRKYIISNKNTGVITIDANASELIDNNLTVLISQWESVTIISDGSIWKIE